MRARSVLKRVAIALTLGALSAGCTQQPAEHTEKLDPALRAHVLDAVPSDISHRTFFDFEGKVHLIGYDLHPTTVAPGQTLKLTLYWQSVAPLGPGWRLYTHILDGRGVPAQGGNKDNVGPLRKIVHGNDQVLGPSHWVPGKVYVDQQEFALPDGIRTSVAEIVVGVWNGDLRLEVLSGPTDGHNGAVVVRVKTGLSEPPRHVATKPKS